MHLYFFIFRQYQFLFILHYFIFIFFIYFFIKHVLLPNFSTFFFYFYVNFFCVKFFLTSFKILGSCVFIFKPWTLFISFTTFPTHFIPYFFLDFLVFFSIFHVKVIEKLAINKSMKIQWKRKNEDIGIIMYMFLTDL